MAHIWTWFVAQVWPNLFASILWAPLAFAVQHILLKGHFTGELEKLRKHVLGAMADERQRQGGGAK